MPRIDFSFSGWVRGADVTECTDDQGNPVDVSEMDNEQLAELLEKGELFISLSECLDNCKDNEVEIFDYEGSL